MPKSKGYNWKARQAQRGEGNSRSNGDQDSSANGSTEHYRTDLSDANVVVLPAKRKPVGDESSKLEPKRKKLSNREKKRLTKIVEVKEKKKRFAGLLESLSRLAVPKRELTLMQPSTSIGKHQRTKKEMLAEAQLVSEMARTQKTGTLLTSSHRRRKEGRRRTKMEKQLLDPLPASGDHGEGEEGEEDGKEEDGEEEDGEEEDGEEEDGEEEDGEEEDGEEEEDGSEEGGEGEESDTPPSVCRSDSEQTKMVGGVLPTSIVTAQVPSPKCGIPVHLEGAHCNDSMPAVRPPDEARVPRPPDQGRQPAMYVQLQRNPDIQVSRLSLPILAEEHAIMEAIRDTSVVVLCGETGSGKTTQVPQFLYEAGYTLSKSGGRGGTIAVTEPRRVAAISMSKRVAYEMGLGTRWISYQIRYEGNRTEDTAILFMTDGVLLKEVEQDFMLSRYSVVIIDEAHERSLFTDVLIGLLSRIVPLREKNGNPLKLIIMSATMRVEDFTANRKLFLSPPTVIEVESRQYPVTVHFNRRTPDDYVAEAYSKVCKIHRTLKGGHILVFVTGQQEVHTLCGKLGRTFPMSAERGGKVAFEDKMEEELETCKRRGRRKGGVSSEDIKLDEYPVLPECLDPRELEDEEGDMGDEGSEGSGDEEGGAGVSRAIDHQLPLFVLPLYSLLSSEQQAKVFEPPPEGVRLCVVATNVAETSITIPNIKYVVDTGKVKRRYYDNVTGASTFRVAWTSKASANQRAGRAGRTEAGHCYRLYSSAVFHNEFEQFSEPEVLRRPVDDLLLQMKALSIDKVNNFPFPTPPSAESLEAAEKLLVMLGALSEEKGGSGCVVTRITELGRIMAQLPVSPRYSKMLSLGNQHNCLPYVVTMVSILSVKEMFVDTLDNSEGEEMADVKRKHAEELGQLRRSWAGTGESLLLGDLMVLLKAFLACESSNCSEEFCRRNGLRRKAVMEVRHLRQQLTDAVSTACPEARLDAACSLVLPSDEQTRYLRQIVLSGMGDHVARKIPTNGLNLEDKKRLKHAYQCTICDDPVYMNTSCALVHLEPQFVVFQELLHTTKLFMRGVTAVDPKWLPILLPHYCTFSPPSLQPPPFFDATSGTIRCFMDCTFGSHCWSIEAQELPYPDGLDKYKLFGQFLLQGKVIKKLAEFSPYLLVAPVAMVKSWANLHKQTEVLLTALVNKEVCTHEALLEVWKEEPKYLLRAVSLWLPESKHRQLAAMWPPSNQESD